MYLVKKRKRSRKVRVKKRSASKTGFLERETFPARRIKNRTPMTCVRGKRLFLKETPRVVVKERIGGRKPD